MHAEIIGNIQNDIIHIFAKLFIYGLPSSSEVINVPASKRNNQRTLATDAAKKKSCREKLTRGSIRCRDWRSGGTRAPEGAEVACRQSMDPRVSRKREVGGV